MEYLFEGPLDNRIHDITYDQLMLLYEDNLREAEESRKITQSSYRGESFITAGGNFSAESEKEYLFRYPKTAGMRTYYPHGIVIEQSERRNFYRGENQIFSSSIPKIQELSPYLEPWMLPDKESGEGVKDFKIREKVDCGYSIAIRNYLSILTTVKYANLSDF